MFISAKFIAIMLIVSTTSAQLRRSQRELQEIPAVVLGKDLPFPLGACQGDCVNDSDCEQGLKCFLRYRGDDVMGCSLTIDLLFSTVNFCAPVASLPQSSVAPISPPDIVFEATSVDAVYIGNGNNVNMGLCEGDCDADSNCANGLTCFQRSAGEGVPGCTLSAELTVSDFDFCYDASTAAPTRSPTMMMPPTLTPAEFIGNGLNENLTLCQGDCDSDSNCAGSLICYQRGEGDEVPGCLLSADLMVSNFDFCTDASFTFTPTSTPTRTFQPTDAPSPEPTGSPISFIIPTAPVRPPVPAPVRAPVPVPAPVRAPVPVPAPATVPTPSAPIVPAPIPAPSVPSVPVPTPSAPIVPTVFPTPSATTVPAPVPTPSAPSAPAHVPTVPTPSVPSVPAPVQTPFHAPSGLPPTVIPPTTIRLPTPHPTRPRSGDDIDLPRPTPHPTRPRSADWPRPTPHPTHPRSQDDGQRNAELISNIDNVIMGLCQGDCDDDSQCADGLVCYHREQGDSLPFCVLNAALKDTNMDFCIPSTRPAAQQWVGDESSTATSSTLVSTASSTTAPTTGTVTDTSVATSTGTTNSASFALKLYWEEGYYWQSESYERKWCMGCRYGCTPGNNVAIYNCEESPEMWTFVEYEDGSAQIQNYEWGLCLQNVDTNQIVLSVCDELSMDQRFVPLGGNFEHYRFELSPLMQPGLCLTQDHHPRNNELLYMEPCSTARGHETSFWSKY